MRIILALIFIFSMLAFTLILNEPFPPQVLYWRDGQPIYQIEDPVYHGADLIEYDPMDGSRTAYHWDGNKYVAMWVRR
jgi:hypothetical protein